MRKIGILLALLGPVAIGAFYLAALRPFFAVSETVLLAERALATPDAVLLAQFNVKQATFLERWFIGVPPQSPSGAATPASADPSLLGRLRAAGIDPRADVDNVLAALYPGADASVGKAIVLTGRFDPAAINTYLASTLRGTRVATSVVDSYEIALTDPASCRVTGTWLVTAAPAWILIADPGSQPTLLSRILGAPTGNETEIAWWRSLARDDVASVGIRNPARLANAASTSFFKSAATEAAAQTDLFQRIYLGFGVKTVPPEGRLRVVMDARDAALATERIMAWRRAVADSRERWMSAMPSVAALYDSLAIRSEGARSTIEITLDRATTGNAQRIANELLTAALSGLGVQAKVQPISAPVERIDAHPAKFASSVSMSELAPYDSNVPFAERVDRVEGPFGLRLDEIRQGGNADTGLELVVAGFTGAIPNLAANPERARLFIDNVKSSTGQELLKREACGRGRNSEPVSFRDSSTPRLRATKTLRLIAGADPRTLQRIEGHVELRLPTRTETVQIEHPTEGATIERGGVGIWITKVAKSSISYEVTGEKDRLLLLRALNAKGQPLDRSMMMSADFLFGGGASVQSEYSGTIDKLELVFAAEERVQTFPFALTDFSLAGGSRSLIRDAAPDFQPYSEQTMRQDYSLPAQGRVESWKALPPPEKSGPRLGTAQLGPFELSLDKAQSFYALRLEFGLRGPAAPNFQRRFNFGQLRVTRVKLKDGSTLTPPTDGTTTPAPGTVRATWSAPIRFMSTPKQNVVAASESLLIDTKAKPDEMRSVAGALDIRFPLKLETLDFDDLSVGQKVQWRDLAITIVGQSRSGLTLQIDKEAGRLVYIRLMSAQGEPLAFFGPQMTELPDGGARIELSPMNPAARAQIVLASEMETRTFPFEFALP